MPSPDGVAINQVWAGRTPAGSEETHTLPSGQVVVARKIAIQQLLEAGVMAEADTLTAMIGAKHLNDQATDVMQAAMRDPKAFGALMMMMDRALPLIVIQPQVRLHVDTSDTGETTLISPGDRETGVIYTDQIDLEDKVWLIQFAVGDLNKLARFRGQSDSDVAAVVHGEDVSRSAKRTAKHPKRRRG